MRKDEYQVRFIGGNAEGVTGSMTLVEGKNKKILLEAGIQQTNNLVYDHSINNRKLDIDLKSVDYIILGHIHADHSMLVPRLVAEGFRGRIIVPEGSKRIFELVGRDSAYITQRDSEYLERRYKRRFHTMYTEVDVERSIELMDERPFNRRIMLDDRVEVRFTPSGHIIKSAQIELWVTNERKNCTRKILYTSDLGNIRVPKHYTDSFKTVRKADLVIGESTYSDKERKAVIGVKERAEDIRKLREVIDKNTGVVEIPVFALDRCQNILTELYLMYGTDRKFKQDIVIDTPLGIKMTEMFMDILEGPELYKLEEVLSWENIKMLETYEESKAYRSKNRGCIILTAAGMLNAGRSKTWLKHIIEDKRSTLVFVGYAAKNTLGGQIRAGKGGVVSIDGDDYKQLCRVEVLESFSSHMQYWDLLKYYSNINTTRVCLVHGSKRSKSEFAEALRDEIRKKCGRAIVEDVVQGQVIRLN